MTAGPIKTPSSQPPLLGITMGDPAGIGPEVIAKAAADRSLHSLCRLVVIGSAAVMEHTVHSLKLPLTVRLIESLDSLQPIDRTLAVL
ncbi:MAG: hypothetical protein LDL14_07895, partial [Nitrospira sp.]|nr:hypothetical protein [Nitrospira sp.]